jgi:starch synthase
MRYECEFDWGGTRIFVSTAIVEGLRCFFIEPRNGFFATPTVYGRYDDEVRGTGAQGLQGQGLTQENDP